MRMLIAGNWKMNGVASQLRQIESMAASIAANPPFADILICTPATLIERAARASRGRLSIGGQDCDSEMAGPHTGDVSAEMLKDAGASVVIVGHSERRQHHGETDAMVAAKAKAAWRAGLLSIICIGETESQRKGGAALSVCGDQIAGSVPSDGPISCANAIAIAYEPLWAIGSGHIPTPEQIVEVHAHIRQCLCARFGSDGNDVRILYGGSVKPANAHVILALPEVGGALVGGASLEATEFDLIVGSVPSASSHSPGIYSPMRSPVGERPCV